MGKGSSQSQVTRPDGQTMDWIGQWRDAISKLNPGVDAGFGDVRKTLEETFARQRAQAGNAAGGAATAAGAFGGDRHGIMEAELVGDVNRSEASSLASLGLSEAQMKWAQIMQKLGLMGAAAGVGGMKTTSKSGGNLLGDILGLGATAGGMFLGGPAGAGGMPGIMPTGPYGWGGDASPGPSW